LAVPRLLHWVSTRTLLGVSVGVHTTKGSSQVVRVFQVWSTQETRHFDGESPNESPHWLALSQFLVVPEYAPPPTAVSPVPQVQSFAPGMSVQCAVSTVAFRRGPASLAFPFPMQPTKMLLETLPTGGTLAAPPVSEPESVPPQLAAAIADDSPTSNVAM
jgi:hypothetical protein